MKILAFDTALFGCSVAVYDTQTGHGETGQQAMPRGQAEALVPMIQHVMAKAGVEFAALDLIAATKGPGAFTGLRIGLATAQGFGLALNRPVLGVTTLDVLAAMFFEKEKLAADQFLCVLIETKRKDYYCQFFQADGSAFSEPQALSAERVREQAKGKNVIFIGDALKRFADADTDTDTDKTILSGYELPDPLVMARLAGRKYAAGDRPEARPLYLRDADVSSPKKEQRVILEER